MLNIKIDLDGRDSRWRDRVEWRRLNHVQQSTRHKREKRFQTDETGHASAPGMGLPDRRVNCHIP
jgi:hypothetical protein